MQKSKSIIIGLSAGLVIVVTSLAVLIPTFLFVPDYRVEVDAIKVQQLVSISNVRITNTGKLPLTELTVNMGQGDIQFFKKLEPGKTIWVSPRAENLVMVTVTTKEGIISIKNFREPLGMVKFGPG